MLVNVDLRNESFHLISTNTAHDALLSTHISCSMTEEHLGTQRPLWTLTGIKCPFSPVNIQPPHIEVKSIRHHVKAECSPSSNHISVLISENLNAAIKPQSDTKITGGRRLAMHLMNQYLSYGGQ